MSEDAKLLKRIASADGKPCAELRTRGGFYFFEEHAEEHDGEYIYLAPVHGSGLYERVDEAERDMIATLPWLRDGLIGKN